MVDTFNRRNGKSSSISTIIINHMVGSNPQQLMALMHIQLRKHRLVPPKLLTAVSCTATSDAVGGTGGGWAVTGVDLEAFVRGKKRRVGPIRFNSTALSGPIVSVPNGAVNAHALVSGKWHALLFHVRVDSNGCLVYQKSTPTSTSTTV